MAILLGCVSYAFLSRRAGHAPAPSQPSGAQVTATPVSEPPFEVLVARARESAAATPAASPPPEIEKDLATFYPVSELPPVATADGARISLGYLARNGADLTRPMPSKHRVFAANEAVAAQLVAWAAAHGFEVRGPELVRSHTGKPQQCLDLVRTEVPNPENIEREGRLVLAAVRQTPGSYYQTWCGEIVR